MNWPTLSILLSGLLLAGCSNLYQGVYEGNNIYKDAARTPDERAMTPSQSYGTYQKDRGKLQQEDAATEKNESPDFNLK
jgi:hypothetical protein